MTQRKFSKAVASVLAAHFDDILNPCDPGIAAESILGRLISLHNEALDGNALPGAPVFHANRDTPRGPDCTKCGQAITDKEFERVRVGVFSHLNACPPMPYRRPLARGGRP